MNDPAVQQPRAATIDPGETRWSIVLRQFRTKRTAAWGLRGTFALVLAAISSPRKPNSGVFDPGWSARKFWLSWSGAVTIDPSSFCLTWG